MVRFLLPSTTLLAIVATLFSGSSAGAEAVVATQQRHQNAGQVPSFALHNDILTQIHQNNRHLAVFDGKVKSFLNDYSLRNPNNNGRRELDQTSPDAVCNDLETTLAQSGVTLDCTCGGDGTTTFTIDCGTTAAPYCEDGICANMSIDLKVAQDTGMEGKVCADYVESQYPDLCIAVSADVQLENLECDVSINGTNCDTCDYCGDDDSGVNIDCSNIREDLSTGGCQVTQSQVLFLPKLGSDASTLVLINGSVAMLLALIMMA